MPGCLRTVYVTTRSPYSSVEDISGKGPTVIQDPTATKGDNFLNFRSIFNFGIHIHVGRIHMKFLDYIAIFISLNFWFLGTQFDNLKCAFGEKLFLYI